MPRLAATTLIFVFTVTLAFPQAPAAGTYDEATRLFRHAILGFTCKVPYGWVLRTKEMSEASAPGTVLLAAFERPPDAKGDSVNSTILIAAEPVASYPGLKDAVDYFTPLTEVTTAKGFKVVEEPYDFVLGRRHLARGDFKKESGVPVYQATLVMIANGSVISFTFLGANAEEVEQLIANLIFTPAKSH